MSGSSSVGQKFDIFEFFSPYSEDFQEAEKIFYEDFSKSAWHWKQAVVVITSFIGGLFLIVGAFPAFRWTVVWLKSEKDQTGEKVQDVAEKAGVVPESTTKPISKPAAASSKQSDDVPLNKQEEVPTSSIEEDERQSDEVPDSECKKSDSDDSSAVSARQSDAIPPKEQEDVPSPSIEGDGHEDDKFTELLSKFKDLHASKEDIFGQSSTFFQQANTFFQQPNIFNASQRTGQYPQPNTAFPNFQQPNVYFQQPYVYTPGYPYVNNNWFQPSPFPNFQQPNIYTQQPFVYAPGYQYPYNNGFPNVSFPYFQQANSFAGQVNPSPEKIKWVCPPELENDATEIGTIAKRILKEEHENHAVLTEYANSKSYEIQSGLPYITPQLADSMKRILCNMLGISHESEGVVVKRTYHQNMIKIHPDRSENTYANKACSFLTEVYTAVKDTLSTSP